MRLRIRVEGTHLGQEPTSGVRLHLHLSVLVAPDLDNLNQALTPITATTLIKIHLHSHL